MVAGRGCSPRAVRVRFASIPPHRSQRGQREGQGHRGACQKRRRGVLPALPRRVWFVADSRAIILTSRLLLYHPLWYLLTSNDSHDITKVILHYKGRGAEVLPR